MNRLVRIIPIVALAATPLIAGCSSGDAKGKEPSAAVQAVAVSAVAATEQPVARFIRATGTLMAEEQADVAAETAGRLVSAAIERATPLSPGAELGRPSPPPTDARPKEDPAHPAQHEARPRL